MLPLPSQAVLRLLRWADNYSSFSIQHFLAALLHFSSMNSKVFFKSSCSFRWPKFYSKTRYTNASERYYNACTVKPVFKTTWEIGTTWALRTATPVPRPIQDIETYLINKTTSELRTVFHSPLGVPNSHVPLYWHSRIAAHALLVLRDNAQTAALSKNFSQFSCPCLISFPGLEFTKIHAKS